MAIPDEISDRLEHQESRSVQQKDIVRVMDENRKDKPWSRYMIQQSLDQDTTKTTVNSRLQELVELDVLEKYEYVGNAPLYDLVYDPIVTDGGRLQGANIFEVVTFRDRDAVEELLLGGALYSIAFLVIAVITEYSGILSAPFESSNIFVTISFTIWFLTIILLAILKLVEGVEAVLSRL